MKKDYTKFSEPSKETEEDNTEIYVEPVVDDETIDTPIEEAEKLEIVEGVLKDCTRLNMRKEPSKESEIVCVIDETVEFTVDLTLSTDDFYKVYTNDHEGYCMKQFINID